MHSSVKHAPFDFLARNEHSAAVAAHEHAPPASGECTQELPALAGTASCSVTLEHDTGTLWVHLEPDAAAKFTPGLLADLRTVQERIAARLRAQRAQAPAQRIRYQVFASRIPGVFSLGGDLALFRECIRTRDADTLRIYARDAVDLVYVNATAYEEPLTTISLVQGKALGGGFEAALAAHVIVAERGSRMGLPEIMFNMFPGMGAYQLLSRRLTPAQAERMILSGRTYTAEELHALGVVDVLAEAGDGERAVRRHIQSIDRQCHGRHGLRRALHAANPLDRHELYRMADVWVDTALELGERDLTTIDYLLRAQQRMQTQASARLAPEELLMEA
jgi:DSF synthase